MWFPPLSLCSSFPDVSLKNTRSGLWLPNQWPFKQAFVGSCQFTVSQSHKPLCLHKPALTQIWSVWREIMDSKSMRDVWLVNTHLKPDGLVMLWKHNGILHTMSCINNKKVGGKKKPGDYQAPRSADLSCISVLPPLCGIFVLAPCPSYISENRKVPGPRMAVQAVHPRLQSIPWHGRRRARGNLMLATQALWSCGSGRALVSEAERFIPPALVVHVWVNTPE